MVEYTEIWWQKIDNCKSEIRSNIEQLKLFILAIELNNWTSLIQLSAYYHIFREICENIDKIIEIKKTRE